MPGDEVTAPSTPRDRALVVIALAVPLGLALGAPLFFVQQAVLQGRAGWAAIALTVATDCFAPVAMGALAVVLLKTLERRKLWFAAGLWVLPLLSAIYRAHASHPAAIALAASACLVAMLACARGKRTLGIWSVMICAACTTGIQLASSSAKYSASALSTEVGPRAPFAPVSDGRR